MGSTCMKNTEISRGSVKVPEPRKARANRPSQTSGFIIETSNFIGKRKGSIKKHYTFCSKLGEGAYGTVCIGIHKATNQKRAIKTIQKNSVTDDLKEKAQFFNEVDTLKQSDHPNIVKLYEFYEDKENYHLVMEHITGGELFDYIVKSKRLSEAIAANILKQLLSAVAYCHSKNIVHRDLKPENLLLEKEGPDAILKIIDFGTSAILNPTVQMTHKYGTIYYIAPEVLSKRYNEKCDLWSCGVILYILLSGKPPFYGREDKDILRSILKGYYSLQGPQWEKVSNEAKSLITKMLELNPETRISAEQALNHPWIKSFSNSNINNLSQDTFRNLQNFYTGLKLQYAILSFISFQLISKEEIKRLSEAFLKIDKNQDGKLSQSELLDALTNTSILVPRKKGLFGSRGFEILNMNRESVLEEAERIMKEVDTNESGFIDYYEFITACSAKEELLTKENINSAFRMLDEDKSGKITAFELREFLSTDRNITSEVWESLISEVDQNGDGEIDLEEFKLMMINYLKKNS